MLINKENMPQNHVLETPLCVSIIRVFQFILAIVLLALAAYGVSMYAYAGFGLTLFTSLATMIATAYILIATELYSLIYNYWAILGLDIFLVIKWLISFSVTAADAVQFHNIIQDYFINDGYYGWNTYWNVLRTTAVFGAIEFIMFIATLCFTGVFLHRHREAGGHCTPHPNPTQHVDMKHAQETQSTPDAQPAAVEEAQSVSV